jgi:hypothetical protein
LWQLIYDEIHAHYEPFLQLASEFARLAMGPQDVPLSLLRLYDILLWMRAARRPKQARR